MTFVFEELRVYRKAMECLKRAYRVAAVLPASERFNLADQLRRAALSVVLNLVESTERRSAADARRFLQVSLGSLVEVVACLDAIEAVGHRVPPESLTGTRTACEQLYRQLHAFRRSRRTR